MQHASRNGDRMPQRDDRGVEPGTSDTGSTTSSDSVTLTRISNVRPRTLFIGVPVRTPVHDARTNDAPRNDRRSKERLDGTSTVEEAKDDNNKTTKTHRFAPPASGLTTTASCHPGIDLLIYPIIKGSDHKLSTGMSKKPWI